MIRCHKCGYFNLHNAATCIKCRTNLIDKEEPVPAEHTNQTDINRNTIIMPGSQETPWDQEGAAPAAAACPQTTYGRWFSDGAAHCARPQYLLSGGHFAG
ncbi:hypothetical protein [Cesiribacter andamanensis]|uniref:Uncharacterized protein n=1 Tax=Cesiribacter andamanensis AMV16 TaxID=1279009 RepID=M7N3V7_9BACT|nr:hypothetical protein [Cesiribacter andamanensis]EMR01977.1 hypothetical protein ADICEAN_02912 [Cesiribacter andamanensis AMV16]